MHEATSYFFYFFKKDNDKEKEKEKERIMAIEKHVGHCELKSNRIVKNSNNYMPTSLSVQEYFSKSEYIF